MVIEYIGYLIRNEVANRKEIIYEEQVGTLLLEDLHVTSLLFFSMQTNYVIHVKTPSF